MNPFIELARDPVAALAWLGYALLMLGIVVAALPWAVRQGATLAVRYRRNRTTDAWWSFGERRAGYVPPLGWLARLFVVVLVLAVTTWALGTIVWLLRGGA
jgi:hypothetical protein